MTNDEKQKIKATKKINLIDKLISSYEQINEIENFNNRKGYKIKLDYEDYPDFTKFKVIVLKDKFIKYIPILEINYSLRDKNYGLDLFNKLRYKFVERDDIQINGFNRDSKSQFVRKNSKIELVSVIHNEKELDNLKKFNDDTSKIRKNQIPNYKYEDLTKDDKQIAKASRKVKILNELINFFSELNNLEDNISDMKKYTVKLSYIDYNDKNTNEKYYKFNVRIIKGYETKPLLDINFSLNNINVGKKLLDNITNNFAQNSKILYAGFNEVNDFMIANKSNIMFERQFDYKNEKENKKFMDWHNELSPKMNKVMTKK